MTRCAPPRFRLATALHFFGHLVFVVVLRSSTEEILNGSNRDGDDEMRIPSIRRYLCYLLLLHPLIASLILILKP
ncbi:unnamed protein product [Linum tenue]|uniref:Secreted peptide n=1 Tax=Linum tenue TaxID=586396 RepID=A0AAV0JZ46_9ROSI|nr:unnamed protein product [Linum tenue]